MRLERIAGLMHWLGRADDHERLRVFNALDAGDRMTLAYHWDWQAHENQREPEGEWRVWLLLAGRGFGKTRTGAEWVLEQARAVPDARIALVGGSLEEAARVMVEGESGILACAAPDEKLDWRSTRHELRFPSGALAQLFSGADGDRLRGPQHHFAWADELGKWKDADAVWDNLMLGLRLGERPRVLVTTTPGNPGLLERIRALPGIAERSGRTIDNVHLPESFLSAIQAMYGGTRLGRQELEGVVLGEAEGALWTRALLERCRSGPVAEAAVQRVVVGVDPPAGENGDACGIVVCARLADGTGAVLADCSAVGLSPDGWARVVSEAASQWGADKVIAEGNNGGAMIEQVLRTVDCSLPVTRVWASRGKAARAEPVAALFEVGRVRLAGMFPALEDELSALTVAGYTGRGSPDRADAMVWALSELMLKGGGEPRVRGL